jgi:hypothetical protein
VWYLRGMLEAASTPPRDTPFDAEGAARSERVTPRDLVLARVLTFGTVATAFPVSALAVFALGVDRQQAADVLAVIYSVGLVLALSTSYWPLRGLSTWTREARVESLVVAYLVMSYVTHLSWELGWLVLHDAIAASPTAPWAYVWWAYIDGGDIRYANVEPLLLAMETLSVTNGIVGATAMTRWLRSGRTDRAAVLVLAGTAAVHLYSASLYYLSEIFSGFPSVRTTSFIATYFKFALANAPWVVVPFVVFAWARRTLAPRAGEVSRA